MVNFEMMSVPSMTTLAAVPALALALPRTLLQIFPALTSTMEATAKVRPFPTNNALVGVGDRGLVLDLAMQGMGLAGSLGGSRGSSSTHGAAV